LPVTVRNLANFTVLPHTSKYSGYTVCIRLNAEIRPIPNPPIQPLFPDLIALGNALALEERQHWYTPAHLMGMWQQKLKRGYALGSALDFIDQEPERYLTPEAAIVVRSAPGIQRKMFVS